MRVVYTPEAHADLDTILGRLFLENPIAAIELAKRIDSAVTRVSMFPESAPAVSFGKNVRVLTLSRYPYRIFYRVGSEAIEILHVRHTSRAPWQGRR
jgi:plasmid stabilization system protein ParE